jgi:NAD(P)H-flavin reductase
MLSHYRQRLFKIPSQGRILNQTRTMATPAESKKLSHVERTAAEPRDESIHRVTLKKIDQINSEIRLLRLSPAAREKPFTFLPGQWLDVHVPTIERAGGFTITSPPSLLQASKANPEFELAIQHSPVNPPAAWLWRPEKEILGSELQVRVGGSFVWPPKFYGYEIKRVVFIAGGVGINPLVSILSHLSHQDPLPFQIKFLYSLRDPGPPRSGDSILFMERLVKVFNILERDESLQVFLTSGNDAEGVIECNGNEVGFKGRRIAKEDLLEALGVVKERKDTVVYICGVPGMTDELVELAKQAEGIDERHVLCEKWW